MNPDTVATLKALGFREDEADAREGTQRFIHNDASVNCTLVVSRMDTPADIVKALILHGSNVHRAAIAKARAELERLM